MASAPWLISLSLMWFGWGALSTVLGPSALFAGTVMALMLLLSERMPRTLLVFVLVWTAGWVPAFAWQPWLLLAPTALVALALWWRRRRRARYRVLLEEFERSSG
ncbi:MAG: hypothetical protein WD800_01325 [Dehalococcoidia bacterium]